MSDSTWVRLFAGQRCRTSTRPKSTPFPSPTRLVVENSYFGGDHASREMLGTAHLLSPRLISAHRQDFAFAVTGSDLLINQGDRVQQNPMVDQMAEALRVAIMTRPAVATLGPEFTSYVLHLVEGYEAVKKKLLEWEKRFDEANVLRKQDAERFHQLAQSWEDQELRYKAEIKRLELIIHDTSEKGVGAVVLARAGSLLRRNRPVDENGAPPEERSRAAPVNREEASQGDAIERHTSAIEGDQYSILTRRRILNPQIDFEMSERIRQMSVANLASDEQRKLTTACQPRPAQGCPHSHQTASSSSSSSSFLSSECQGGADGSDTPLNRSSDPIETTSEAIPPIDWKDKKEHKHCEGTPGPREKATWVDVESGLMLPTSESLSAGRNRHRRVFSFVPGDDSLELVGRSIRSVPISTKDEAALDLTSMTSMEKATGNAQEEWQGVMAEQSR